MATAIFKTVETFVTDVMLVTTLINRIHTRLNYRTIAIQWPSGAMTRLCRASLNLTTECIVLTIIIHASQKIVIRSETCASRASTTQTVAEAWRVRKEAIAKWWKRMLVRSVKTRRSARMDTHASKVAAKVSEPSVCHATLTTTVSPITAIWKQSCALMTQVRNRSTKSHQSAPSQQASRQPCSLLQSFGSAIGFTKNGRDLDRVNPSSQARNSLKNCFHPKVKKEMMLKSLRRLMAWQWTTMMMMTITYTIQKIRWQKLRRLTK